MRRDDPLRIVAENDEKTVQEARAELLQGRRRQMLNYNLSIVIGSASIGTGVYLVAGLGWSLVAIGTVVIALTLYSVERLNRRTPPRVLDRTST